MLKAILFDLDGTLFDSFHLLFLGYKHAVRQVLGIETTDADWQPLVGLPLHEQMGNFSKEMAGELVKVYREFYAQHHDEMLQLFPGVTEAVQELNRLDFILGAVTSKKTAFARRGLAHLGLEPYFQVVVGEDDVLHHKPAPDPVLCAIERLSVQPDEALMIGDAPYDIQSAHAAKVQATAVLWGPFKREQLLESKPDFWLKKVEEIVPLAKSLRS